MQTRIVTNPNICHGKPCIRGTRVMASVIADYLRAGESVETILHEYPTLCAEDVEAVRDWLKNTPRE